MSVNVSDFLIQRLNEWGIRRIYGFPGDGINGIIGAIGRAGEKVDYIQVRHEEMSAFMACAHSKFTGEVGVCLATSGPGAVHLLNGLYDAKMDHQSVVAIVGQQARAAMGGDYQQEAVRIAKAERTVTCIIVPNDLQEVAYEEPPRIHGTLFSGVGFCTPRVLPPRF
jgi:pyruvate dehydrogenase (quinone)